MKIRARLRAQVPWGVFWVMMGAIFTLFWGVSAAVADDFTVTNTNDSGLGSLRQAILDSNAVGGHNTVSLTGVTGTIKHLSDLPAITASVVINGPGAAKLALDGGGTLRSGFWIGTGVTVQISGLTLQNGSADDGGGIWNQGGTLTLTDCTVSDNSALGGGGILNLGESGTATLTLEDSTVSDNSAFGRIFYFDGGGISNFGIEGGTATLTIQNSTVSGNSGLDDGGGILNLADAGTATLTIQNSTVSGNSADTLGGGIFNVAAVTGSTATVTLVNSTVSGNSVYILGGGIFNSPGDGTATVTVTNSTISGNSTTGIGGGIYSDPGGTGTVTINLQNTILAGNTATGEGPDCWGTFASQGYNLVGDNKYGGMDCIAAPSAGDQLGNTGTTGVIDPQLAVLGDYGGSTQTRMLCEATDSAPLGCKGITSPAIGQIPFGTQCGVTAPYNVDQRGISRPQSRFCDIGAVERHGGPSPIPAMNELGLMILVALLTGIGYMTIRRRRRAPF